jgi:hypothetical protein
MDPAAALAATLDDVVDGRSEAPSLLEAQPELDALDDVDAHDRRGQGRVQPAVPMNVGTDPDRQAVGDDLEDAADGVAVRACLVDPGDHRRLGLGVGAAQRRRIGLRARACCLRRIDGHATHLGGERPDVDAELGEDRPRDPAGRDPGRRFSRRGAFKDIADVVEAVLERAGEIGVSGPDPRHRRGPLVAVPGRGGQLRGVGVGQLLDLHHPRPVLPVAVRDEEQDGRPERDAVPDARDDLRGVVLDRLARAAPVAALAPPEIDAELLGGQAEPRRDALDGDGQRAPMRLTGGQPAQTSHGARRSSRAG